VCDIIELMKIKKIFALLALTGFLFNISHELIFKSIDPCMSTEESLVKSGDLGKKDPLCEIHQNLHQVYTMPEDIEIKHIKFLENYCFNYKKPYLKDYSTDIFKPPKQIS